jgi:hemolysin activation/secretion protein
VGTLRAERQLASTNDFARTLGAGTPIGSLFGFENFDWVDRSQLAAGLTREFGPRHASALRVELARGKDAGFDRELTKGFFAGTFRANRPVTEGDYLRSHIQLELGRNIVTSPLVSGFGATMFYDRGDGDLQWQRGQVQSVAQRMFGPWVLAARADVATVSGQRIPCQQLIEIGGAEGLPGYDYKAFTGTSAAVARTTIGYSLPLLDRPLRISRLVLPAIAPQVQLGLFTGRTWVSQDAAQRIGDQGWTSTNGWKGSVDVRLRLFSGVFSIGASRPIDRAERWKATIGFGGSL